MDSQQLTFRTYRSSAIALFLLGWGGLFMILYLSLPFVWSRWAFFVFGIELRAFADKELNDFIGAAIRSAHQRSDAH